jgi:hypothetical protein
MGEIAAGLVLGDPVTGASGDEAGARGAEAPLARVLPVPGEVILRESTIPRPSR